MDLSKTEGKGTVNITTAEQLSDYSKGEETEMETFVRGIAEAGANVVVSGQSLSDLTLHYVEKYKLMAIVVQSKFNMRRICVATRATPLVRIGKPLPEELGECESVDMEEIGSTPVVVFRTNPKDTYLSTILIRGATPNILDDIERAIDDGVNAYKNLAKDPRAVPGAGSIEIELARRLRIEAEKMPGLEQYAYHKFAEALEVIPRTLAETSGMDEIEAMSSLHALHESEDKRDFGIDVEGQGFASATSLQVWDLSIAKQSGIRLAVDAAVSILRVDQIIMAKPAGGPKLPKGQSADD
jgi:T-complex protein 1 subunit theta